MMLLNQINLVEYGTVLDTLMLIAFLFSINTKKWDLFPLTSLWAEAGCDVDTSFTSVAECKQRGA